VIRLVAWISYASGATAAVGVAFVFAMFVSFAAGAPAQALAAGRVNDVLVMVSYLLAVPSVIGIGALAAIVVLQWLLITKVLSFEAQVGLVSIALFVIGVWFVVTGYVGGRSGLLPRGGCMGILAATYIGYPIWAFWFGRHLLRSSRRGLDTNPAPGSMSARTTGGE
jgi:hypothetical protein